MEALGQPLGVPQDLELLVSGLVGLATAVDSLLLYPARVGPLHRVSICAVNLGVTV
jgi:hypothetical protein